MYRLIDLVKPLYIFLTLCFLTTATALQAQEPTIATCVGEQFFCLEQITFELCVEITVDPDFNDPIDYFEIDWGDDTTTEIPASNDPMVPLHIYTFDFFNSCQYDQTIFVTLTTFIIDGPPVANIIPLTFQNPPIAMFGINPGIICAGNEACFIDDSCPTEGLEIVSWDYGDGMSGTEDCHTYTEVGTYEVTLTVENACGIATTSQFLQVIEPAQADGIAVDGTLNDSEPYIVCLGDGIVQADGDSLSLFESIYEWQDIGNNNYIIDTVSNPDVMIQFTDTGSYQIILEVDNACMQPDLDTILFEVLNSQAQAPSPPARCL